MSGAFSAGGVGLVPSYNPADFAFMGGFGVAPQDPISVLGTGSLVSSGAPTNFGDFSINPGAGGVLGTGMNGFQIANAAIGGLQTLGSLWMASKQMKLAKKQFKLTKELSNINLNNQMQSYNTALADRARSRGVMEGQTQDQVQGYIDANTLTRDKGKNNGYSVGSISNAALSNYSAALASGKPGYTPPGSSGSSSSSSTDKDKQG